MSIRCRYQILYGDMKMDKLSDRGWVFNNKTEKCLTGKEVIQKINEFVEKYPDFEIVDSLLGEVLYIVGGINDSVSHHLRVNKES